MNIVLLITVTFTLALGHNNKPCQKNTDNNAYNSFVQNHILQEWFDRGSVPAWERYISEKGLCNRPKQSFFESSDQCYVVEICNGHGRPLLHGHPGNLCISESTILGYYIEVNNNCRVKRPVNTKTNVIVACDIIDNRCLPVHFEKYTNQRPDRSAGYCGPRRYRD